MARIAGVKVCAEGPRLRLESFSTPTGRLVFDPPVELDRAGAEESGVVALGLTGFGVVGLGRTLEAALRDLCAEIAWLWWEYAEAPEEELSGDARDLARRLREAARLVRT
ncbi:MAG: hypothetical protein AB1816_05415 [Bacillota bacterium]